MEGHPGWDAELEQPSPDSGWMDRYESAGEPGWVLDANTFRLIDRIPGHSDWVADMWFEVSMDGPAISGVHVVPAGDSVPPGGLTMETLRAIGFTEAVHKAWKHLADHHMAEEVYGVTIRADRPRGPGRPGYDDRYYARWAERYIDALSEPSTINFLATTYDASESTVRNTIRTARKRGMLTPTKRGVRGGELTGRARRLLDGTH